ncbi:hypothetical protein EON80_32860 [bacterium]|nr:MAG: hypothetical protein EON80_32860 [bacterium]
MKSAAPWQKAVLEGLSNQLGLKGELRIADSMKVRDDAQKVMMGQPHTPTADEKAIQTRYDKLKNELENRFPDLKNPAQKESFAAAKVEALKYLSTRKADVKALTGALDSLSKNNDDAVVREALAWRFIRTSRTLFLEAQLATQGTAVQKAAFTKLRAAESTNPLR